MFDSEGIFDQELLPVHRLRVSSTALRIFDSEGIFDQEGIFDLEGIFDQEAELPVHRLRIINNAVEKLANRVLDARYTGQIFLAGQIFFGLSIILVLDARAKKEYFNT